MNSITIIGKAGNLSYSSSILDFQILNTTWMLNMKYNVVIYE